MIRLNFFGLRLVKVLAISTVIAFFFLLISKVTGYISQGMSFLELPILHYSVFTKINSDAWKHLFLHFLIPS
jgi:hypothetical protein